MPNNDDPQPGLASPRAHRAELAPSRPTSAGKRGAGLKAVLVLLALALMGGAGWVWMRRHRAGESPRATVGAGRPGAGLPVPVVPGVVESRDVPIYLDGLGTVQAFNTVTVRSRVDGQVQRIAFTEGQDVRAGDLLAQIDP